MAASDAPVNEDPTLFLNNWDPEGGTDAKKTYFSRLLPFVTVLIVYAVVSITPFPPLADFVILWGTVIACLYYIFRSLIKPTPWLQRYGWWQWDKYENEHQGSDCDFVNALIQCGIIDAKTRVQDFSYDVIESSADAMTVHVDLRQAGKTMEYIQKAVLNTAPALGAYTVQVERVGNTDFNVIYSFLDPVLAYDGVFKDTSEHNYGDPFTVAVHQPGNVPITIQSNKALRAVVSGSSGSGKSICLQKLLCDIATAGPDHQAIILDPKRVGFVDYVDRFEVINTPENFTKALECVYAEMMRRYDIMQQRKVFELTLEEAPLLYVVVDEVGEFFDSAEDKREMDQRIKLMTQIVTLGRQANIGLTLAGQTIEAKIVPSAIRNNLDYRLILRMFNKQQAQLVCPEGMEGECPAHMLPETMPGIGYFLTSSTGNHFQMGRVYYFDQSDIRKICAKYAKDKRSMPWLAEANPMK